MSDNKRYLYDIVGGVKPEYNTKKKPMYYTINHMCPGARFIFQENVYCVLGISCNSGREERLNTRDRFTKMTSLGVQEVSSEFDLMNVEKPDRSESHMQSIRVEEDHPEQRFLWFLTSDFASTWQSSEWNSDADAQQYDRVLAGYYYALICDPYLKRKELWRKVLNAINRLYSSNNEVLKRDLTNAGRLIENPEDVEVFRSSIVMPLIMNIRAVDAHTPTILSDLLEILKSIPGKMQEDLFKEIGESAKRWVTSTLKEMKEHDDRVSGRPNGYSKPTKEECERGARLIRVYTESMFPETERLILNLKGIGKYAEVISQEVALIAGDCVGIVFNHHSGNGKIQHNETRLYYTNLYPYSSKKQKLWLIDTFGSGITSRLRECTYPHEYKDIAEKLEKEGKKEKAGEYYLKCAREIEDEEEKKDLIIMALIRGHQEAVEELKRICGVEEKMLGSSSENVSRAERLLNNTQGRHDAEVAMCLLLYAAYVQNDAEAYERVGNLFDAGTITRQKHEEAQYCYIRALSLGNRASLRRALSWKGMKEDSRKTLTLFAALYGDERANKEFRHLYGDIRDLTKGFRIQNEINNSNDSSENIVFPAVIYQNSHKQINLVGYEPNMRRYYFSIFTLKKSKEEISCYTRIYKPSNELRICKRGERYANGVDKSHGFNVERAWQLAPLISGETLKLGGYGARFFSVIIPSNYMIGDNDTIQILLSMNSKEIRMEFALQNKGITDVFISQQKR